VVLNVGYSHPVEVSPAPGIVFTVEGTTKIKIIGIDKEAVGLMAAKIKAIKPHDAYKGKGLRYAGEKIKLKAGKAVRQSESRGREQMAKFNRKISRVRRHTRIRKTLQGYRSETPFKCFFVA